MRTQTYFPQFDLRCRAVCENLCQSYQRILHIDQKSLSETRVLCSNELALARTSLNCWTNRKCSLNNKTTKETSSSMAFGLFEVLSIRNMNKIVGSAFNYLVCYSQSDSIDTMLFKCSRKSAFESASSTVVTSPKIWIELMIYQRCLQGKCHAIVRILILFTGILCLSVHFTFHLFFIVPKFIIRKTTYIIIE